MNPAVPILLLLSLIPLAFRRRGAPLAWAVTGLAAMALLAPALAIPDGVPSPAATLGAMAPWQGWAPSGQSTPALDPSAGNPHLRDITHQVQPWLLFLRAEIRDGRLPYWNPYQFAGTPFWSNGSSAPLFPLHLLFAALPAQLGLVLLPWLRLVIGGTGAFVFARQLGVSDRGALVAAVAFPLSGVVTSWVLYPMGNCHPLVPWVLWATERVARRPGAWPWLAALAGLELLGGHPETPVFTGMLAGVYLLVRWPRRPVAGWSAFAGAWIVGLLLAAIELVPLAATVFRSSKWLVEAPYTAPSLGLIGRLLLRVVMPEIHGNPALGTWWGPFNYPATAIYAGAITLPLALLGSWVGARSEAGRVSGGVEGPAGREARRAWLGVAALTLFAMLAAYQIPGVRHLLRALPVIDKSLTHYLKLGLDFGLAILAARGADAWLAGTGRRALAAASGAVLALLGLCWLLFRGDWGDWGDWARTGAGAHPLAWSAGIAVAVLMLWGASHLPERGRRRAWIALPILLACDLSLAHAWTNPALSFAALYPETGAVRALEQRSGPLFRIAGTGSTLHPNAGMVYRLYDVRGDTPVKLHHFQEAYATFAAPDPVFFQPIRHWDHPWLDRLGVRWVITPPGEPAPSAGGGGPAWRPVYDGPDARIYRRPGALPVVRWKDGEDGATGKGDGRDGLRVLARSPGSWSLLWETDRPRTLVVAEAWDPGWRAWVDGEEREVERVDGALLGVRLGDTPSSGGPQGLRRLQMSYRPEGLELGAGLSLLGLLAVAAGFWQGQRRTA